MAGKKISELIALGADFAVTDLFEISATDGGSFLSRKITGAEIASSVWATNAALRKESFIAACSDEDTALTTGAGKAVFRMPYAFTLTAVRASLKTAGSTSGVTTIDINLGGSSIFTTNLLTIDYGDKTSVGATTAPNITTTALTDDGEISIDIDGLSGGATETGLKVTLIGYQTP
jgi:hypothetical protein